MRVWRFLAIGAFLFLLALSTGGCRTSYHEWSGAMPNESGKHVQPFDPDNQVKNHFSVSPSVFPLFKIRNP